MCVSNDNNSYPSPPISLSLKSIAGLPLAPCVDRCVSEKANEAVKLNLEDLCIPLGSDATSGLRLSMVSSNKSSEGQVRNALHRMSSNVDRPSVSFPSINKKKESAKADLAIAARMALLMKANQGKKNTSSRSLAGGRSASPVPLLRGVRRHNSGGAALCA